jgi:ribonuclease D
MEKNLNLKSSPEYTYVDTADSFGRLLAALCGTVRVGLDTEADSRHHYFEKVCLMQLSFSGSNYIVDPLAGLSLDAFFAELSGKELILQGADYDLRMLKKSFSFRPKVPIFDTMLAAQVLGDDQIGLAGLAKKFCGVTLTHAEQQSDWSRRPLTLAQLRYASDDTKYLEAIADAQTAGLRELGRTDWHRECCERVVEITGLPEKNDGKDAWRIKGTSKLPPQVLVFVRELWKWRDAEARRRDRPPFMILRNEDLIQFAGWCSENYGASSQRWPAFLKRMTGENLVRLERAVRVAEALPSSEWPLPPAKTREHGEGFSQKEVESLLGACRSIAAGLRIEACFLASRAAVTAVVRNRPKAIEEVREVSGLMRWQAELLMPAISAILD